MATATTSMTRIRSSPNGMADNLHLPGSSVSVNKRDPSPYRFGGIGRRLKSLIPTRSPTHVEPYTYNQHAKSVDGFSSHYDDEEEDDMTLQDHLTYADHSSDSGHDEAYERDRDATLLGHGYDQQRPGRQRSTAQQRLRTRRPTTNPPTRVSVTYNTKRDSIIVPRRHREGPFHAQRQQSQLPSPPLTPPKSPQSDEDIPTLSAHLHKAGRALRAIADMPWVAARVTDDIIPTPRTAPASWYARRARPPARVPSPVSQLDLPPIGVSRSRMGTGTGSGTPSGMETPTSARMYFDGESVRSPGSGGTEGREPPWHRDYAYYAAQPVYAYPSSPQDQRGGTQRDASQHHRRYHSTPHLLSELQDQPSATVRSPPQPQRQPQRQNQSYPPYRPTYNPQSQSQSHQTRHYAPPLSSTQSQSHSQNRNAQGLGHSRIMSEAHAQYRRDFERELFAHDPPPFRAHAHAPPLSSAPHVSYSASPLSPSATAAAHSSARSPTAFRTPIAPRGLGSRSGSGTGYL